MFGLKIQEKAKSEETINCRYYVPAWAGNKTSGSQPDFCLKHRVVLCGKCVKSCKEQKELKKMDKLEPEESEGLK